MEAAIANQNSQAATAPVQGEAPLAANVEISLDRLYTEVLIPCFPDIASTKVLKLMLGDRESAGRYAGVLKFDPGLQEIILKAANSVGLEDVVTDPAHAVQILGLDLVRDVIIGRGIYFSFYHHPEKNPLPPSVNDYANYVTYARRSMEVAKALKDPHPELAYAGGVLYDYLKAKLESLEVPKSDGVEGPQEFIENVWVRSIRAGIAAKILVESVSSSGHRRFSFIAGLVHNIGKLVLYAHDPKGYMETLKYIKESKADSGDDETRRFGIDHAQAGSLYLGQQGLFGDIEQAVDFHHSISMCRFQNLPVYHFAGLIYVAARIVRLVKDKESIIANPKDSFFIQEEFLCLGIDLSSFIKVQKRYLKLRDFQALM